MADPRTVSRLGATRLWFRLQLGFAAALLVGAVLTWILIDHDAYLGGFGDFMSYMDALFVFPGLALSVVINALVFRLHGHAGPSTTEIVLLAIEVALVGATLAFQILMGFLFSPGMLMWALLVAWAVAVLIVFGVRNSGIPDVVRRGAPAPAVQPPPPPV